MAEPPKTPPNHPKHAPPIPFTPTEDVDKKVQIFATGLRTIFEKFLKDDVQLPLWQPPLGLDDRIRRHITDLKIPIISHLSQFPLLLLHNLGKQSHDAQLANRVERLFRPESM